MYFKNSRKKERERAIPASFCLRRAVGSIKKMSNLSLGDPPASDRRGGSQGKPWPRLLSRLALAFPGLTPLGFRRIVSVLLFSGQYHCFS